MLHGLTFLAVPQPFLSLRRSLFFRVSAFNSFLQYPSVSSVRSVVKLSSFPLLFAHVGQPVRGGGGFAPSPPRWLYLKSRDRVSTTRRKEGPGAKATCGAAMSGPPPALPHKLWQ